MLCKILRLFANTLTADDTYFFLNRDKLIQAIQILFSLKENIFSQFFSAFLQSALNFQSFQNKDRPHSQCNFETTDSKKGD